MAGRGEGIEVADRRRFLKRAGAAAVISVPLTQLLQTAAVEGSSNCRRVRIAVNEQCTAPANPPSNACNITGTLPELGIDGADIVWMVTLFHGLEWRIQFQAFSEAPERECQYPLKVRGSYLGENVPETRFVASSPFALGLTPEEHPELTLRLAAVKIDPCHPTCG